MKSNKTWESPIVVEMRRVKEKLAAKFNYNIDAIFRDLKGREKASGHKYVDLSKTTRKPGLKKSA